MMLNNYLERRKRYLKDLNILNDKKSAYKSYFDLQFAIIFFGISTGLYWANYLLNVENMHLVRDIIIEYVNTFKSNSVVISDNEAAGMLTATFAETFNDSIHFFIFSLDEYFTYSKEFQDVSSSVKMEQIFFSILMPIYSIGGSLLYISMVTKKSVSKFKMEESENMIFGLLFSCILSIAYALMILLGETENIIFKFDNMFIFSICITLISIVFVGALFLTDLSNQKRYDSYSECMKLRSSIIDNEEKLKKLREGMFHSEVDMAIVLDTFKNTKDKETKEALKILLENFKKQEPVKEDLKEYEEYNELISKRFKKPIEQKKDIYQDVEIETS